MEDVNQRKYEVMLQYVQQLQIKEIRQLFVYFRKINDENTNVFFPAFGLTAGEFSVMYIQNMSQKLRQKQALKDGNGDVWLADDTL